MPIQGYRHSRLMEESQSRLEAAARAGPSEEMLVASRIVEHPTAYRLWEAEHDRLIRTVSAHSRLAPQIGALRSAAFGLIHRKALFEYLREREINGARRHKLFSLFYGSRDYANAVLAEHASFIRCSSSYLCADHLAEQLMRDAAFDEPLQLYQEWYAEYFRVFCDVELADTPDEKLALAPLDALKPLLKYRLKQARDSILALPQVPSTVWREVEIRRATGETQKLRRLSLEQRRVGLSSATNSRPPIGPPKR
ncbi:MAG: hypothetical protein JWN85_3290 [Gammaproteobacteria bacterium]|nr:hypothetical protein [Gammaproteobacteria bacterium]